MSYADALRLIAEGGARWRGMERNAGHFEHAGQSYACATDGHVLVVGPPCDAVPNDPPGPNVAPVAFPTSPPAWSATLPVADLVAWCGPAFWPEEGPCGWCTEGRVECECPACPGHDCDMCSGSGKQERWMPPLPGSIGGAVLNRRLVARVLSAFDGAADVLAETRESSKDPGVRSLRLSDSVVVVLIMSMRLDGEDCPAFPGEPASAEPYPMPAAAEVTP